MESISFLIKKCVGEKIRAFFMSLLFFLLACDFQAYAFTAGNIIVLQTSGSVSKASNPIVLNELTPGGSLVSNISLPVSGSDAIQTSGVFGGSEGFLTTSTDGKYLVIAGYNTSSSFTDITATAANSVPRVVGKVTPSGIYIPLFSSTTFYNLNDIRGGVSDGTNVWVSGASTANTDGINYFGPGTPAALATGAVPAKAYGLRIFNGRLYYSTQKAGPVNTTSQLGIFTMGNGLPVSSASVVLSQVINTGTLLPQDFSFSPSGDTCYIAISMNTASGGIQKWVKSNGVWSLAYTLSTGATNIGAYGLLVDYTNSLPILYATTYETTGNRVIKLTDSGAGSIPITMVSAVPGIYYKGISFSPVEIANPTYSISLSPTTLSEITSGSTTITANLSSTSSSAQTVGVSITGAGVTAADYIVSDSIIQIPAGAVSGSITLSIVNDGILEGNETASVSLINPSSGITPGTPIASSLLFIDNNSNTPPTIVFNSSLTSNLIDGGLSTPPSGAFHFSGVLNDSIDPVGVYGLWFDIADIQSPFDSLNISVMSSNTVVLPLNNVTVIKSNGKCNIKMRPVNLGYTTVTLMVSDGISGSSFALNFAVSDGSPLVDPPFTFWHTGMSDGSTAVPLDSTYYIAGDDELNTLNVYYRNRSGMPLRGYDYTAYLNLPNPSSPEVDVEASAKSPLNTGRIYWSGSMSNGKLPYDNKPNRDRLFATTVSKTADSTDFVFSGYVNLRTALLAWGDSLGYNFTASAAAGVNSKALAGFSLEGMVFGPDNTTLYLGLRAPLVPVTFRHKALIVPVLNFESWFNNGHPSSSPSFGGPIELDLDFRGIREIIRLSSGTYILVAGSPIEDGGVNNIYKWTGNPGDSPIAISNGVGGVLNIEGVMEVHEQTGISSADKLQLISDGGAVNLYGDNNAAKDFSNLSLRKFRSDVVPGLNLTICNTSAVTISSGSTTMCVGDSILLQSLSYPHSTYYWSNGVVSQNIYAKAFQSYFLQVIDSTTGCVSNSNTISISKAMPSDFDNNNRTDNADFLNLLGLFGQTCMCEQDLNKDGIVSNSDFLILLGLFNRNCP
jgi:hypothetical protein